MTRHLSDACVCASITIFAKCLTIDRRPFGLFRVSQQQSFIEQLLAITAALGDVDSYHNDSPMRLITINLFRGVTLRVAGATRVQTISLKTHRRGQTQLTFGRERSEKSVVQNNCLSASLYVCLSAVMSPVPTVPVFVVQSV